MGRTPQESKWANVIHARELRTTLATAGFLPAHVPTLGNVLIRFFLAPVFFIEVLKFVIK